MIVPIIVMSIVVGVILFFGIKMFINPKKSSNKTSNVVGGGGGAVIDIPTDGIGKDDLHINHKEIEFKRVEKEINFRSER